MSCLSFEYEWEDPGGAKGDELRATWSRLQIRVGDTFLTKVEDLKAHSVRSGIYLPLYPIAEWIATHWWLIFNEVQFPGRGNEADYWSRHNVRFGREGFSFPDLFLRPNGSSILVEWKPFRTPGQQVVFLEAGRAELDYEETRIGLSTFLDGVTARLDSEGVADTLLQDEWRAIRSASRDEAVFCKFAAKLGLDPYNLSDYERGRIVEAYEKVHADVREEFFTAADWHHFESDISWLKEATNSVNRFTEMRQRRNSVRPIDPLHAPWTEGYRVAREMRQISGTEDKVLSDYSDIARALGVTLDDDALVTVDRHPRFDALFTTNGEGNPGFLVASRGRPETSKFAFCRAVFEYLAYHTSSGLVSRAPSERQKRSRAFAAEFLLPEHMLRSRIKSSTVDEETVADLGEEFGVSTLVVQHQMENHKVATLVRS